MYQDQSDPQNRIIVETVRLMGAQAGKAVVRDIAAAAGVSPALVVYRFGDMEGLRLAAMKAAHEKEEQLWDTRGHQYLSAPLSMEYLGGLVCELLAAENVEDPALPALRWLRSLDSLRAAAGSAPVVMPASEARFWDQLAVKLGIAVGTRRTLTAFYHGLSFGHVIAGRAPGFQAWSIALVHRFVDRLKGGAPDGQTGDSGYRAAAILPVETLDQLGGANTHMRRQDILAAALRILVEDGAAALTHRRLAAAAGASVSSVTHFFGSRKAILQEAYAALYLRLRSRALQALPDTSGTAASLSVHQLAEGLQPRDPEMARAIALEMAGLLNAVFEASRDPDTRQLALAMFAQFGATSRHLLERVDGCRGPIGWLDAQIFRLVSNGLLMLSRDPVFNPHTHDAAASPLSEDLERAMTTLFITGD